MIYSTSACREYSQPRSSARSLTQLVNGLPGFACPGSKDTDDGSWRKLFFRLKLLWSRDAVLSSFQQIQTVVLDISRHLNVSVGLDHRAY
jgi:hypothetical protein